MIKKLFYFIIPFLLFSFSQNVKAEENQLICSTRNSSNYLFELYYNKNENLLYQYYRSNLVRTIEIDTNNYYIISCLNNYSINVLEFSTFVYLDIYNNKYLTLYSDSPGVRNEYLGNGSLSTREYSNLPFFGNNFESNVLNQGSIYVNFDLYNKHTDTIYQEKNIDFKPFPKLSYTYKPIYKDGYISSYGIKVNSSIVDDTLYKYQYAIKYNINDKFKWIDLYNNNFLNNEFTYIAKKPVNFYFRIIDKSNNKTILSFDLALTFNLVSPQYDIIFNQSKYYLNGTNIIDRVGLSITFKTSLNGLKYQYQYVENGSSLNDNNWIDTENDIFKVYKVNGVLYARILDNNNNVLYSSSFSNSLIGKQDILDNPVNFPLYNKVQSVLNFNNGSISDLVLVPVKVLMFISDSLNNNVCSEYSFGKLLDHELKLPCIDIKSLVGETIYNFYDLVCSFFISLGIIKLLKNIYMRFMTLEIRDIDRNGGIF